MSSHCAYHCLAGASSVSLRLMAQDQSDAFYYLHSLGALHSFSFRQPETNMAAHQPVVIDLDEDIVIARPGTPARYQNEHGSAAAPQPAAVLTVPGRAAPMPRGRAAPTRHREKTCSPAPAASAREPRQVASAEAVLPAPAASPTPTPARRSSSWAQRAS